MKPYPTMCYWWREFLMAWWVLFIICILISFSVPQISKNTFSFSSESVSLSATGTISKESLASPQPIAPKKCFSHPEVTIFMYHYVRDDDPNDATSTHELSVTPANFESHMQEAQRLAKEKNIAVMNGNDFSESITSQCFPSDRIWLFSSDDGWVDSATNLAPIAEKYQIPFIFWIISDRVWKKGYISQEQLLTLARHPLFTIASHTVHHKELNTINTTEERTEICESKTALENLIQSPVHIFIYPVGKIGKKSVNILQECGYTTAWSTNRGTPYNRENPDWYTINRVRIHHDTGAKIFNSYIYQ